MSDLQQQLNQFFKDNNRGYPRDPRRMAYAKLRKNIAGKNEDEIKAFIDANLFIPHSQYKMALANLIKLMDKHKQTSQLNEVRQFQKLAGLLKETWHPGDLSHVDLDDIEDEDPEDFDDISETEGEGTDYDESSDSESDDTDAMGGIDEWAGMSPEHANTFELIDKLKDFKKAGKLNDINFKKAEDYIHKNAADLYYDYPDTVHALKQVFKAIKAGVSTGTEYTVDSVVPAVQKLADELVAKGKYKPEQSKRVVAYAAKHKDELLKRLSSPIQWFNASSEATQHGTR